MKGMSFNVTLSQEQIQEIAAQTADKVLQTNRGRADNQKWNEEEISRLRHQISNRNEIIVQKEIIIERTREVNDILRRRLDAYKEKFGDIEEAKL